MWGKDTLAIAVSSNSMKVARVTVMAMSQGLPIGRSAALGKGREAVREPTSVQRPLRCDKRPIGRI